MIDVPCAFEQHATGGYCSHHSLIHVILPVIGADVGHSIVKVFLNLGHHLGSWGALGVHGIVVSNFHNGIVVRNIAERFYEAAVFPTSEEAGDTVPMVVGLIRQLAVVMHCGESCDKEIPLAYVGEVPRT